MSDVCVEIHAVSILKSCVCFFIEVPSHLLIEPDGKTLHSFGFDAQEKFAQLEQDSKHKEWYYFRNIGMVLLDKNVGSEIFFV